MTESAAPESRPTPVPEPTATASVVAPEGHDHPTAPEPAPAPEPVAAVSSASASPDVDEDPEESDEPKPRILRPAEGCPHPAWELRWQHRKAKRKVEDCPLCGTRRFTDGKDQTLGTPDSHAPWVKNEHREAYEKSRRPA